METEITYPLKKCHDLNYSSYPMLEDKGFGESKKVRFRSREQGCLTRRVKRGREGQLPVLLRLVSDMFSVISDAMFYTSSSGYVSTIKQKKTVNLHFIFQNPN